MAFKKGKHVSAVPDNPEALLRDLRGRKIPGPLAHQADVIREYLKHQTSADVALQLPTGSGKTLIGLLLGEWRRRKNRERVVYCCPTNQLVHQVAAQANERYGMNVVPFTGAKTSYNPDDKAAYENADSIAITNYSSLFNINPYFDDPQLIILDDAHSAENYIGSFWSLRIERGDPDAAGLFERVVAVLRPAISRTAHAYLNSDRDADRWALQWTEKIPTPKALDIHSELASLLDEYAQASTSKKDIRYTWTVLRDHLTACHLYVSSRQILIRPLVPPTNTHAPFANALQRIYMSATLGESGDLERTTGRSPITRIPIPPGWDKQGIGRRFFVLPMMSLSEEDATGVVTDAVRLAGRGFVIAPSDREADKIHKSLESRLKATIFTAKEIEESKAKFIQTSPAIAIAANRYDGIDLRDDECRVLAIVGLPQGANLQEQFFLTRLGAKTVLAERIHTRVVQAFGRCTRSANDYAAVIILGESLQGYLTRRENRRSFHPEIQAELEFGIDQSRQITREELAENLSAFLKQNEDWQDADEEIVALRATLERNPDQGASTLQSIVDAELRYTYAMWNEDYLKAHDASMSVLGGLDAPELRGYRALWCYLAGSAAWLAAKYGGVSRLELKAREHFATAMNGAPGVRWLGELASLAKQDESAASPLPRSAESLIERLEQQLEALGIAHNRRFDREEREILEGLRNPESTSFESSIRRLGTLLGYDAGKVERQGSPDPWWIADDSLVFVFEANSDGKASSPLNVKKARQVATHPNWIREHLSLDPAASIVPVLVTPKTAADKAAIPHLRSVRYWATDSLQTWAKEALAVVRNLRRTFPGPGDLAWRAEAIDAYRAARLFPEDFTNSLRLASDAMSSGETENE